MKITITKNKQTFQTIKGILKILNTTTTKKYSIPNKKKVPNPFVWLNKNNLKCTY